MIDFIANFISLLIVLMFICSFFNAYCDPSKHITLYKYFTDFNEPETVSVSHCQKIYQTKRKGQTKNSPKKDTKRSNVNAQLKKDCDLAMKSLGVDAKQRKYLITKFFKEDAPKTVEEFISQAFA